MAKAKSNKSASYEITALKSASGPNVNIKKGGTYQVPGQIGDAEARDLIKAKLAKKK